MTNTEKVLAILQKWPGLNDDDLSRQADIHPRQQINQICRRLEKQGLIRRAVGANGKIANTLVKMHTAPAAAIIKPRGAPSVAPEYPQHQTKNRIEHFSNVDVSKTLFIIPCSKSKNIVPATQREQASLWEALPPLLGKRFAEARASMRSRAHIDDTVTIVARQRYSGVLYQAAAAALAHAADNDVNILIVSGGYGIVHFTEPIGNYEARFRISDWPRGLLEEILIEYARSKRLTKVRALASASSDYYKLLAGTKWRIGGIEDALLFSPHSGPGAMRKTPRAEGEAFSAMMNGTIGSDWKSSDDLALHILRLV